MAKKKQPTTEEQSPYKTLFDHIEAIYSNQKRNYFSTLSDGDKKTYNTYMVNKFLSMNVHQLPLVNEVQKYQLSPETQYLFYASVLPKGKQFNKFVKAAKEQKFEPWLVDLIRKVFEVSGQQAEEYLTLYYAKYPEQLRRVCEDYGVDPKLIKKAKL